MNFGAMLVVTRQFQGPPAVGPPFATHTTHMGIAWEACGKGVILLGVQ